MADKHNIFTDIGTVLGTTAMGLQDPAALMQYNQNKAKMQQEQRQAEESMARWQAEQELQRNKFEQEQAFNQQKLLLENIFKQSDLDLKQQDMNLKQGTLEFNKEKSLQDVRNNMLKEGYIPITGKNVEQYYNPKTSKFLDVGGERFMQKDVAQQKPLSSYLQNVKDKKTYEIIDTISNNTVSRDLIKNAKQAAKNITGGLYGKVSRDLLRQFNPGDPALADWQKIKMVLTDAQLLNTAKTKGSISDREMELFAKAAANDDVASIQQMKPVFDKLLKLLDADESAKMTAFKKIYKEDPMQWEEVKSLRPTVENKKSESINYKDKYGLR